MASSTNPNFTEEFMDFYVPYVAHILQSDPKNARDVYRMSTHYFEDKLRDREQIRDETKEEEAHFSKKQTETPAAAKETAQLDSVCYEADFLYDSIIEIHPATEENRAGGRKVGSSPEEDIQKEDEGYPTRNTATNFDRAMKELKRNLAEIVSDYERAKLVTGNKNSDQHAKTIPESSDTGSDVIDEREEVQLPREDNGVHDGRTNSNDMRPGHVKNMASIHGEDVIPKRVSSDKRIQGRDPPTRAKTDRSAETLSLQKAFGVDSLTEYREVEGGMSRSTTDDEDDSEVSWDDSGTRPRRDHASGALSRPKTRNLCRRDCWGGGETQAQKKMAAPDSEEALRDFASPPKSILWKLSFFKKSK